jgi:hypothetical protein
MGDIISSVADVIGIGPASKQADAVESAAGKSADAAKYAADIQKNQYDQTRADQQPYRDVGYNALAQLNSGVSPGGQFTKQFDYKPFSFNADPGYGFRLSEGIKALERSSAARGGLLSGAALKGISRYGQDYASNEYGNAFNRYNTDLNNQYNIYTGNRTGQFNNLATLAGVGQTANNALGTAGASYANNVGNIAMNDGANQGNAALAGGQIRASSYQGLGNALGRNWDSISGAYNKYFNNPGGASFGQQLDSFYSGTGGSGD